MSMKYEIGTTTVVEGYEPPRVESVLTADELEREVQYAGTGGASPLPPG